MSYDIERGKRVLSLRTDDRRLTIGGGEVLLYVAAMACNNVRPRNYDWSLVATDSYHNWNGEIQLPRTLWNYAYAADGGSIKLYGRGDVSGTAYIRQWKKAAAERRSIHNADGGFWWLPSITFWLKTGIGGGPSFTIEQFNNKKAALFGKYKHEQEGLWDSFVRLFARDQIDRDHDHVYLSGESGWLDALHLFSRRDDLPISIFIESGEHTAIFADGQYGWDRLLPPSEPSNPSSALVG